MKPTEHTISYDPSVSGDAMRSTPGRHGPPPRPPILLDLPPEPRLLDGPALHRIRRAAILTAQTLTRRLTRRSNHP